MSAAESRLLSDILGRLVDIQEGQKTIIDKLDLIEPAIKGHEARISCLESDMAEVKRALQVPA